MNQPSVPPDLATAKLQLAQVNGTFPEKLTKLLGGPAFENVADTVKSIWRSATHVAKLHQFDHCLILEVHRTVLMDNFELEADPMTWEEIMQLKAEAGFGDTWAVEMYPPHRHSLRSATSRYLWILENEPDYGWRIAKATEEPISLSKLNGFNGHSHQSNDEIPENIVDALLGRNRLMP